MRTLCWPGWPVYVSGYPRQPAKKKTAEVVETAAGNEEKWDSELQGREKWRNGACNIKQEEKWQPIKFAFKPTVC